MHNIFALNCTTYALSISIRTPNHKTAYFLFPEKNWNQFFLKKKSYYYQTLGAPFLAWAAGPAHWLVSISRANVAAPTLVSCIQFNCTTPLSVPSCAALPPIDDGLAHLVLPRLVAYTRNGVGVHDGEKMRNSLYNDGLTHANPVYRNHTVVSSLCQFIHRSSPWLSC